MTCNRRQPELEGTTNFRANMARELTMSEIVQLLEDDDRRKRSSRKPPLPPRDPAHHYLQTYNSSHENKRKSHERKQDSERERERQQSERDKHIQTAVNEQRRQQYIRHDTLRQLTGMSQEDARTEQHRAYAYRELEGDNPWEPVGWSKRGQPGPQGCHYPGRASAFTKEDQEAYEIWYERDWCKKRGR